MSEPMAQDICNFFDSSPTSFHAVELIATHLKKKKFIQLNENLPFQLEMGQSYFVVRNGSIIAFSIPKKNLKRAVIIGSHTDSPSLKLKPQTVEKEGMELGSIEVYGGPHIPSWAATDLKVAGRLLLKTPQGIEQQLVDLEEAPIVIANAPIHLDPSPNNGEGFKLDPETQLRPILSLHAEKKPWIERVTKKNNILAHDLFLVPCDRARYLGLNREWISSYRIDNLVSAFGALQGITQAAKRDDTLQMALFWDHEEIGSGSEEGAASPFFLDLLQRITIALNLTDEAFFCMKNQSFALSLDAAHAYHPNYPSLYSQANGAFLGQGTAIKINGNKKYASSAPSMAKMVNLLQKHTIPYQHYVNHASKRCGSTIGHIFAAQTGIETLDMGTPILGMHSVKEQMASSDLTSLIQLCQTTFEKL